MDSDQTAWDENASGAFIDYGRYFVPERERQIEIIVALISHLERDFTIYELCCGEGLLAEALLERCVDSIDAMKAAAREIATLGAKMVVVKGGHLGEGDATDVLFDGERYRLLEGRRIEPGSTHGTGCTFSSAVAAYMARGESFFGAVEKAKAYITGAIAHAFPLGKGCGPTHHFFDLYRRAGVKDG